MALARLPGFVAEYLEGGSEDERTLVRNREAFDDYRLVHRVLVDVSKRSTASTVLGQPCGMPMVIAPTGFNGLLWRNGDIALARAARANDVPFAVSIVSSDSVEDIAKHAGGRLWMQLLVLRDANVVERLIARAEAAGCEALVLTLDVPMLGNRSWDARNFSAPYKLSLRSKLDVLAHPRWFLGLFLRGLGLPSFGNLDEFLPGGKRSPLAGAGFLASQANAAFTWDGVKKLRDRWPRKLVLKGVMAVADAEHAVRVGADAIVLSNHGGRQLDSEVAPLDVLAETVAAVGGRIEILVDGGFRRGTDIAKALALGARAVLLGRATLYGIAAAGQPGAARALEILRAELDRAMAMLGCPTIADLSPAALHRASVQEPDVASVAPRQAGRSSR